MLSSCLWSTIGEGLFYKKEAGEVAIKGGKIKR